MATPQEMVDDAACLCGLDQNELLRIIAYASAVNAGMPTDAQSLVDASACLCGLNQNDLLRIIAANGTTGGGGGGGGGGTNNLSGAGSPVGVVTPGYVGQFYTDTNSPHAVWTATGPTSADWVEVAGNLT